MTHLLPGGGVPRVHRARSPVPSRLPLFATPRSVHRLAAVAAGAYPSRHPPDVWSPGAPAPLGPCYWVVASGTPVGWRGGCLAFGLERGAVRHYCLGGCSALVVCARRSQPIPGGRAGAWCRVLPVSPFQPRFSCAVRGGPSRLGVPFPRLLVRHSMRSVRSAGSVRLPFWYSPRVLCFCVRSRSRGVRAPPPLPLPVWCAHFTRSRCRALVGPFHSFRTPPRFLPRSRAPFGLFVFWGGGSPVPFPPYLASGCVPPVGGACASGAFPRWGVGWGGGTSSVPFPPVCAARGPVGLEVALPRSVPLASLGRQQSGCSGRRSCHGGRGPHTIPVRAPLLTSGAVRVAPWCVGAGSSARRGSCGSRRLGRGGGPCCGPPPERRGPARGEGDHCFCLRGLRAGVPVACGSVGGVGGSGGIAPWLPSALSWGGGGLRPSAQPPSRRRRILSWCMRLAGMVGQPRAPDAACRRRASLAGGGGTGGP